MVSRKALVSEQSLNLGHRDNYRPMEMASEFPWAIFNGFDIGV